jgi:hypothetical protein
MDDMYSNPLGGLESGRGKGSYPGTVRTRGSAAAAALAAPAPSALFLTRAFVVLFSVFWGSLSQAPPSGVCACFSVAYYQPFFNVDTSDVKDRLVHARYPFACCPPHPRAGMPS